MSKITNMCKDSSSLLHRYAPSNPTARLACLVILATLLLAGIIPLVLYLIYRPSKPHFAILSFSILALSNSTTPSSPATALSSSFQYTLSIRNPSPRSSAHYYPLHTYVTYKDQAITPVAEMQEVFQEEDSTVAVSSVVGGEGVPVSAETAEGLMVDEGYGVMGVRVVVVGRVRFRSRGGEFRSGGWGMYVRCDLLLGVKKGVFGQVALLGGTQDCNANFS